MTAAPPLARASERVIRLTGDLDLACREDVRALLAQVDDGEPLVVDLSDAGFVDIQTVALLVRRRGETELRGASPIVVRVATLLTHL